MVDRRDERPAPSEESVTSRRSFLSRIFRLC